MRKFLLKTWNINVINTLFPQLPEMNFSSAHKFGPSTHGLGKSPTSGPQACGSNSLLNNFLELNCNPNATNDQVRITIVVINFA